MLGTVIWLLVGIVALALLVIALLWVADKLLRVNRVQVERKDEARREAARLRVVSQFDTQEMPAVVDSQAPGGSGQSPDLIRPTRVHTTVSASRPAQEKPALAYIAPTDPFPDASRDEPESVGRHRLEDAPLGRCASSSLSPAPSWPTAWDAEQVRQAG